MNWIDWTGTVLGTLCFATLAVLMKGGGGRGGFGGGGGRVSPSWVLKSILALLGGVLLAFSIVGEILRYMLGYLPGIVVGGFMAFAIIVALIDILRDRNANKAAVVSLALIPALLVAASGPIADRGGRGVTEVHGEVTSTVGPWLGG